MNQPALSLSDSPSPMLPALLALAYCASPPVAAVCGQGCSHLASSPPCCILQSADDTDCCSTPLVCSAKEHSAGALLPKLYTDQHHYSDLTKSSCQVSFYLLRGTVYTKAELHRQSKDTEVPMLQGKPQQGPLTALLLSAKDPVALLSTSVHICSIPALQVKATPTARKSSKQSLAQILPDKFSTVLSKVAALRIP